jgi:hypothetical protein
VIAGVRALAGLVLFAVKRWRRRRGGVKAAPPPPASVHREWRCQCGQDYLVTGSDRHRIYWLADAEAGDPVLGEQCVRCGARPPRGARTARAGDAWDGAAQRQRAGPASERLTAEAELRARRHSVAGRSSSVLRPPAPPGSKCRGTPDRVCRSGANGHSRPLVRRTRASQPCWRGSRSGRSARALPHLELALASR